MPVKLAHKTPLCSFETFFFLPPNNTLQQPPITFSFHVFLFSARASSFFQPSTCAFFHRAGTGHTAVDGASDETVASATSLATTPPPGNNEEDWEDAPAAAAAVEDAGSATKPQRPKRRPRKWTTDEEISLFMIKYLGYPISVPIARRLFPDRSRRACRDHYNKLRQKFIAVPPEHQQG
ncbi:hypothetical protein OQA88_7126 [Cercophora sp. LCS_1]